MQLALIFRKLRKNTRSGICSLILKKKTKISKAKTSKKGARNGAFFYGMGLTIISSVCYNKKSKGGDNMEEETTMMVRVAAELHQKLKIQAATLKRTIQEIVDEAVKEWLGKSA